MGCAFFTLLAGVIVIVGGMIVLVWLGGRRIIGHIRQEPQALPALVEHLVRPLLGGDKPEAKRVKGTIV